LLKVLTRLYNTRRCQHAETEYAGHRRARVPPGDSGEAPAEATTVGKIHSGITGV